jgi:hypothetical protein
VPRLMAVSLTEQQVRDRAKTVTRRAGWLMLQPGHRLTLCRKVMGRKGEPLERIADVEVTDVRREALDLITPADVTAEGFPGWTPAEFVAFFCASHRGCQPGTEVTRIEWRYLDDPPVPSAASPAGTGPSGLSWVRAVRTLARLRAAVTCADRRRLRTSGPAARARDEHPRGHRSFRGADAQGPRRELGAQP